MHLRDGEFCVARILEDLLKQLHRSRRNRIARSQTCGSDGECLVYSRSNKTLDCVIEPVREQVFIGSGSLSGSTHRFRWDKHCVKITRRSSVVEAQSDGRTTD